MPSTEIFDLNSDSKAYKYFESVRKEKNGQEHGNRGFRPILNYRPGSRTRNLADSPKSIQTNEQDETESERLSKPDKDPVSRIPGRPKPTYSEDKPDQPRFDSKKKNANKNLRPPVYSSHEEPEYDEGPEDGGHGSDQAGPRKPSLQASFDYEGDIDEDNPFADRLKAVHKGELSRSPSSSPSSSSSSSPKEYEPSSSNSTPKENEEGENYSQNRRSDDEATLTTMAAKPGNGKKDGVKAYSRRNGKSIHSNLVDRKSKPFSLTSKGNFEGQSLRNRMTEQVADLLGLEQDEEEDAQNRQLSLPKSGRSIDAKFDEENKRLDHLFQQDSFYLPRKPNKKWNFFEAQKQDNPKETSKLQNKKSAKDKKSMMERVYNEDNTDFYSRISKHPTYKKYPTMNK